LLIPGAAQVAWIGVNHQVGCSMAGSWASFVVDSAMSWAETQYV